MAITTRVRNVIGNRTSFSGTLTCTAAGETLAIADTKSRILTFVATNSDGQESAEVTLNSSDGTEDTAMGSVRMVHAGADADVWNYEATLI